MYCSGSRAARLPQKAVGLEDDRDPGAVHKAHPRQVEHAAARQIFLHGVLDAGHDRLRRRMIEFAHQPQRQAAAVIMRYDPHLLVPPILKEKHRIRPKPYTVLL